MRRLLIQPQARLDLLEIWHHIARDNVPAANRVSDRIESAIRDLLVFPGKGHIRPDVPDTAYRFWSVFSYLVAYRYDDRSRTLVRVIHGRRDIRAIFDVE